MFRCLRPTFLTTLCTLLLAALVSNFREAHAAIITRDLNVSLNARNIESYSLDLDLNGTIDFKLDSALVDDDPDFKVGFNQFNFTFGGNNGIIIDAQTSDGFPTTSVLALGDLVNAADLFAFSGDKGNLAYFTPFDVESGNFPGKTGYVGLRFDGMGGIYYGFAGITVNAANAAVNPYGLTIGTVGFNDISGQGAIVTAAAVPEPGLIGVMVLIVCGYVVHFRSSRIHNGHFSMT